MTRVEFLNARFDEEATAAHSTLWDVEVKRHIAAACARAIDEGTDGPRSDLARLILGLLAAPYVGREDYREEWDPPPNG